MKIEKITKLKNDKYKIIFDDMTITTYDEVIIKNNILYKQEISDKLIDKILKETTFYDKYNKVLKYVLKKVRCLNEVDNFIKELEVTTEEADIIKNKVVSLNLVNDKFYVQSYINDKTLLSNDSLNKIRKDLKSHSIDINIIDEVINTLDYNEEDKLRKIIHKKIKSNKSYSNYLLKNKIINECIMLGYDKDLASSIFDENKNNDYDILINEYRKIYNKLSKKYSDQELNYKLKENLYRKGFNYDNIKKEDL